MSRSDAENLNKHFVIMAKNYGYTGKLNKFSGGTLVSYADIVENMDRLFEHRFDAELKLLKERLGVK